MRDRQIIAADLHLRPYTWARLPLVCDDAYESLRQLPELCQQHDADLLLLGDIFDEARPDAHSVKRFAEMVAAVRAAGRDVRVLQGNHDYVPALPAHHTRADYACWATNAGAIRIDDTTGWCGGRLWFGLDYTPPGRLAERLAKAPAATTVLFTHQSWAEVQRVGHTDGSATMLPPGVTCVFTGDYHQHCVIKAEAHGCPVTFFSPGTTCLQAMNESPHKLVFLVDFRTMAADSLLLRTRPFLRARLTTTREFDGFVDALRLRRVVSGAPALPDAICKPLIQVQFADGIERAKVRLEEAAGGTVHLEAIPIPTVREETQVDCGPDSDGFETLASAISQIGAADDPAVVADAIRLVESPYPKAEAERLCQEFMARYRGQISA